MIKLLKYFAFYTISLLLELFRLTIYYSVIPFVPLIKYFFEEELKRNEIHDFTVKDDRIFQMIASSPIIGFMQAYINGYFECNNLLQLHEKLAKSRMTAVGFLHPYNFIKSDLKYYLRLQNQESAYEDGGKGYDVNIELIEKLFIGDCHGISCPYFRGAETLEEAVNNMRDLIGRKLKLKQKMRILDIGCGFGGLVKHLADKYDIEVVGITVAQRMAEIAENYCSANKNVKIYCMDFREMAKLGMFDRIVCVEMIEHIGINNFDIFFNLVRKSLKDDGLFLLHVIGFNNPCMPNGNLLTQNFINTIFSCPNLNQIVKYTESSFVIEDWQNYGNHFAIAFEKLYERIESQKDAVINKYGVQFYRGVQISNAMAYSGFLSRRAHVWHIVFSKNGIFGGYDSEN